jgi:hypothetical protein
VLLTSKVEIVSVETQPVLLTSISIRDDGLRRAACRDRVLRAAVIAAVVPVAVWIITRWLSRVNPVDFLVYRYASALALHGANVYAHNLSGPMIAPGGMPYTYTPFALIALLPTVLGGWRIAYLSWCLAAVLAIAWAENAVVTRVVPVGTGMRRAMVLACALTITAASTMMINEISFGQINSLLLLACLADLFRPRSGRLARLVPPGTLVGIATAIKLTPGLLICYFAVTGQWRLARNSALSCIACLLAGTVAYPGMSAQFYSSVIWHLPGRVAFGGGFATYGNNSVQGILAAIGPETAPWRMPASIVVAALGLWAARACHNRGCELDAWLITGVTSQLAAPVSWIHHWVWLAPAVLLAAVRARTRVARAGARVTTAMLLIGPGTGNNLLHHGPGWELPFAALQRECLVTAGLWCIAMFLAQRPGYPMSVNRPRLGFLTRDEGPTAIFRETGDRHSEGMALGNLGLRRRDAAPGLEVTIPFAAAPTSTP